MGSNYCGEQNHVSERSGGSSSRKGKKNSSSDKPKQPQRGLGVAQLEKSRLHSQMGRGYINPTLQTPYPVTNYPIQEDVRPHAAYNPSSSSFSYSTPSSTSYGFHGAQNMMMGLADLERANIRYGDSQTTTNIPRWNGGNTILDAQHYQQPSITRHLLNLESEEFMDNKKKVRSSDSMGSAGSQNSGSSGTQEIDLELRLSL